MKNHAWSLQWSNKQDKTWKNSHNVIQRTTKIRTTLRMVSNKTLVFFESTCNFVGNAVHRFIYTLTWCKAFSVFLLFVGLSVRYRFTFSTTFPNLRNRFTQNLVWDTWMTSRSKKTEKKSLKPSDPKSKVAALAAILKIQCIFLNQKAIHSKLGGNIEATCR